MALWATPSTSLTHLLSQKNNAFYTVKWSTLNEPDNLLSALNLGETINPLAAETSFSMMNQKRQTISGFLFHFHCYFFFRMLVKTSFAPTCHLLTL